MTPKTCQDLAIFGGAPAFDRTIHVGRPNIGDRDRLLARINAMLDRRWLSNRGPLVIEFEQQIQAFLGVKHCIAVTNGTIALELAIRALDLSGEVIVPSFTFIATAHALAWAGLTPVFVDIDPDTHNLDPAAVARAITPRTSAILGVHVWGRPCDVEALEALARQHDLKLFFDAAHAFGCSANGHMIGRFGSAEVFSFHATKFFNTFEGGAITTDDDALARRLRLMKNFGFTGYDQVSELGTNGKMSEVAAAMGLTGLESIHEFIATNRRNYDTYRAALGAVPGLKLIGYDAGERNNYQYIVVEVDEGQAAISRDELVDVLHAENILARRYFYPGCHQMEPYRSQYPHAGERLPVTEWLSGRVMALPTGQSVSEDDIRRICQIIGLVVANTACVRERLTTLTPASHG